MHNGNLESDKMVFTDGKPVKKFSEVQLPYYVLHPDEIETITIPPSTELVPDEYEHEDNQRGLVLIFYSLWDVENMKMLRKSLIDHKYNIPDTNIHKISKKKTVLDILKNVAEKNHEDKTCFILIFMGNSEKENQFLPDDETDKTNIIFVKDVWRYFTADKCPSLRQKPKIFIFQASKKIQMVQFDNKLHAANLTLPLKGVYDVPAEADMLLIYKRIEATSSRSRFFEKLCYYFNEYGDKEDLISLVTCTDYHNEKRPLLISTLTRKFYLRPSDQRGHHHEFHENHGSVTQMLEDLRAKITSIHENQNGQIMIQNGEEKKKASNNVKNKMSTATVVDGGKMASRGRNLQKTVSSDSEKSVKATAASSPLTYSKNKEAKIIKTQWKY